jgi:hypothetical protein
MHRSRWRRHSSPRRDGSSAASRRRQWNRQAARHGGLRAEVGGWLRRVLKGDKHLFGVLLLRQRVVAPLVLK